MRMKEQRRQKLLESAQTAGNNAAPASKARRWNAGRGTVAKTGKGNRKAT